MQMMSRLVSIRVPTCLREPLHRLRPFVQLNRKGNAESIPPILQIDAIWVTLLRPPTEMHRDRKGRNPAVKDCLKCTVFVATGGLAEEQPQVIDRMLTLSQGAHDPKLSQPVHGRKPAFLPPASWEEEGGSLVKTPEKRVTLLSILEVQGINRHCHLGRCPVDTIEKAPVSVTELYRHPCDLFRTG